jgi:hypothetical protein
VPASVWVVWVKSEQGAVPTSGQIPTGCGELSVDARGAEHCELVTVLRVPEAVVLELRRHVRDHAQAGPLFHQPNGEALLRRDRFYDLAWRPALLGASLSSHQYKFHALRHFAASSMLAEGVGIPAAAAHLGHSPAMLLSTYAHFLVDDADVPALALDRALSGGLVPALRPVEGLEG